MADVSLPVLIAPFILAGMAVAGMILMTDGRMAMRKRSAAQALGYDVDEKHAVALTPARYVGGHPDLARPLDQPYVLLTDRDLALFQRNGMPTLFTVPLAKVEEITTLTAEQMAMAAGTVRGLAPGALEDLAPGATFARVRFEDDRGWWQNVVFELAPAFADVQLKELNEAWRFAKPKA